MVTRVRQTAGQGPLRRRGAAAAVGIPVAAPVLRASPLPSVPEARVSVRARGVVAVANGAARATVHLRGRAPQEAGVTPQVVAL